MKLLILSVCIFLGSIANATDVYINGYTRSNGTYVQPHYRTAPDSNPYNNYSSQGNYNPYTGSRGYSNPYGNSGSSYTRDYDNYGSKYKSPFDNE
jgi:hypothetical protein